MLDALTKSLAAIPPAYRDLFASRSVAFVATFFPDGSPHLTPTWVDLDEGHVLVTTVRDNRKDRNIRKDPRLTLAIADPENPYRYLSIRGEVVDRREEDAREHLDRLAERYTGQATYSGPSGQQRVLLIVRPDA